MTDASLPAGRFTPGDFRVGQVFSRTWSVFSRNFLTFVLVTALPSLLPALLPWPPPPGDPLLGVRIVALLLYIVLRTFAQAVLFCAAFQVMRGRPIDLVESARIGLRRFFPIVGIAIIVPVLAGLAALLFVFPGLMLYTMWWVATPVCVVEHLGASDSMERSAELTKSYRWKIFGILVLLAFILIAGLGVAGAANLLSPASATAATAAWYAVWIAFDAIFIAVTYHDLRVAKEGIDTDQIAAVFE
jgi:hypothetical protein